MTPSDLKALIESDAEAQTAAAEERWSDCAARCTVIAPPLRWPVEAADLRRHTQLTGTWGKIKLASQRDTTPDELRVALITFVDRMEQNETMNFDLPQVKAMVAGVVAAGLVTQAEVDAIDALANKPQTFTPLECRIAIKGA